MEFRDVGGFGVDCLRRAGRAHVEGEGGGGRKVGKRGRKRSGAVEGWWIEDKGGWN